MESCQPVERLRDKNKKKKKKKKKKKVALFEGAGSKHLAVSEVCFCSCGILCGE